MKKVAVVSTAKKTPKRRHTLLSSSGFSSAASVLLKESSKSKRQQYQQPNDEDLSDTQHQLELVDKTKEASTKKEEDDNAVVVEILLTIVGWKYHKDEFIKNTSAGQNEPTMAGTPVTFRREPSNEHDPNAIAAKAENGDTSDNKSFHMIGHIRAADAAELAPLMDSGMIHFSSAQIRTCFPSSFHIFAQVASKSHAALLVLEQFQNVVDTTACGTSKKISTTAVELATAAPYDTKSLKALPWNPLPKTSKMNLPLDGDPAKMPSWYKPFDASKWDPLTEAEIQETRPWPPSDTILLRLGLAPSSDSSWYRNVAGLLPPSQWMVSGALDILPHIQTSSKRQKTMADADLDGAIHGVNNVWHEETLQAIRKFLHQSFFWCQRSGDALIRAFGGPYVLGQDPEKLKLVRGSPHTELTRKMAVAHNIVYTLVHLVPPAEPGFNTLIFGLNLHGPGFHYHQDSIPSLAAKNAPLVPNQPVVTTVIYECPDQDSGKEVVLWKPLLNFSPVVGSNNKHSIDDDDDDYDNVDHNNSISAGNNTNYLAARAVSTTHGMIHVQHAGLQKKAVHGIFHAPGGESTSERQGYRVAITARITKPDAEASLRAHEHQYRATFGPEGNVGLPPLRRAT